jgi:valyl-tRNA synthetase
MHAEVDAAYDAYEWPVVARGLYGFVWDEFADWYLESVKERIYGDDVDARHDARAVLAHALEVTLRSPRRCCRSSARRRGVRSPGAREDGTR